MKVLVIGSTGMLGHVMCRVLDKEHDIHTYSRYNGDLTVKANIDALAQTLHRYDAVVNCCGLLRQRLSKEPTSREIFDAFMLNSYLPQHISHYCRLIHISTDCVFSGRKGSYVETDLPDVQDVYGRTKALGDPQFGLVLRTSIVGPEKYRKLGLYEWFMSQKDSVNGFTSHLWNGLTTRQLSLCVLQALSLSLHKEDMLLHVFSNTVSKFELLELFNKYREDKVEVRAVAAHPGVDRTLASIHDPVFQVSSLEEQIRDMHL